MIGVRTRGRIWRRRIQRRCREALTRCVVEAALVKRGSSAEQRERGEAVSERATSAAVLCSFAVLALASFHLSRMEARVPCRHTL